MITLHGCFTKCDKKKHHVNIFLKAGKILQRSLFRDKLLYWFTQYFLDQTGLLLLTSDQHQKFDQTGLFHYSIKTRDYAGSTMDLGLMIIQLKLQLWDFKKQDNLAFVMIISSSCIVFQLLAEKLQPRIALLKNNNQTSLLLGIYHFSTEAVLILKEEQLIWVQLNPFCLLKVSLFDSWWSLSF